MRKETKPAEQEKVQVSNGPIQSLIKTYGDTTFKFYARDSCGVGGLFDFKLCAIKKLTNDKAILNGDINYENEPFKGNIIINFANNSVYHIARKTRYRHPLEVDNRTKDEWESFCAGLLTIARDNKTLFDETMKKTYELDGEDYNPSKKNK